MCMKNYNWTLSKDFSNDTYFFSVIYEVKSAVENSTIKRLSIPSIDFEITCWRSSPARIWNLKRPLARTAGEGSGGGGRRRTACRQVESVRRRAGSLIRCGWMEGASAPDREWTRPVIHEVGAVVASERDQSACLSQPVSQPEPEEKRVERAPCCRWCCCCWCRGPGPPPPACPCCCSPRRPRPTTAPLASSTKSGWVSPGPHRGPAQSHTRRRRRAQLPRRFFVASSWSWRASSKSLAPLAAAGDSPAASFPISRISPSHSPPCTPLPPDFRASTLLRVGRRLAERYCRKRWTMAWFQNAPSGRWLWILEASLKLRCFFLQ